MRLAASLVVVGDGDGGSVGLIVGSGEGTFAGFPVIVISTGGGVGGTMVGLGVVGSAVISTGGADGAGGTGLGVGATVESSVTTQFLTTDSGY